MINIPNKINQLVANVIDGQTYVYEYNLNYIKEPRIMVREHGVPLFAMHYEEYDKLKNYTEDELLDMVLKSHFYSYRVNLYIKFFQPNFYNKYRLLFEF